MSEVAVVGAGPVGLAAALAARHHRLPVTVLEAGPEHRPRPGSRAIFVHRATLDLLDTIHPGLGATIADAGLVWRTRRTLWRGRPVHTRTYHGPAHRIPFTSLPQTAVEDLLRTACHQAGAEICWAQPVTDLRTTHRAAELITATGYCHRTRYVIAADGARSTVRARLGIALQGTTAPTGFAVADLTGEAGGLTPARIFHYRHPAAGGRNVLLVPFAGGWRVDVQCRDGDEAARWAQRAAHWLPGLLPGARPTDLTWSSAYRFHQKVATTFTDAHHRVLLAGEAAHLLPPFGARGMNSGIADAVAAAAAIARATPQAMAACARGRRAAALANARAAGRALDHLQAARPLRRTTQHAAALLAPRLPRAGRWLDHAPFGPPLHTVPY
ncbi:FAD-dependent monooxygenase [Streptomyces spectabilis]|uniref:3-(3-hydroxy-phenyl)propionate hydroxylase n=1 Tax=Streptomyces spectabilis TaxID=68270 RepID=A0A5P2WZ24_STRST|nr:FAD-dependent monooxygenase [Streptomyces spectabilis]MBB5107999.1 3-(3-hydroxy-phenyl)propionate hydroxylase [Streptomyces spectabilis]MCI3907899.1 FAD-dependent monooxygenase [Streptomyces spectabilis]QEV57358.1 monooxygenase [Streptomyces spectabilis]GGV53281.1 putative monooxygenase [Streptomyces spectabilis]